MFLGVTLAALPAAAQNIGGSAAQALFEQARALMQDDHFDQACPKFAESLRLDPALGTLLNLALCHEKQGKTATAYLEYSDAGAQALREGDSERQALSDQRVATLEPRLIRLSIDVASAPPPGLWLSVDGTRLEAAALGVTLPIDPGVHTLQYGAPGRRSKEVRISAADSELRPSVVLSELELDPVPTPFVAGSSSAKDEAHPFDTRRLAAGACLGGGFVALVFGAYSGFQAGAEWDQRDQHCESGRCDKNAKIFGDSAHRFALLSNVGIGVGLAAMGVGIYLFATRKDPEHGSNIRLTAVAQASRGMLSVGGGF